MRHAQRPAHPSRAVLILLALGFAAFTTQHAVAGQAGDYLIGPQDLLSITVFDQADLSGKYVVELDGSFSFPLIGRVKVAGMTIGDVETELRDRLAKGYFKNPRVSVAIEQYRSQRVFIVGEVRNAGTYALTGDMTLIEALAKAGSTTSAAGDEIVVTRGTGAGDGSIPAAAPSHDGIRVSLKDLQTGVGAARHVALRDGDTIYVPRAEAVYVFGEVKTPGSFAIQSGMTVLQALSLAGGLTPYAAPNRVEVIRQIKGAKKKIKVKLDDIVQPGDTIVVPERFF